MGRDHIEHVLARKDGARKTRAHRPAPMGQPGLYPRFGVPKEGISAPPTISKKSLWRADFATEDLGGYKDKARRISPSGSRRTKRPVCAFPTEGSRPGRPLKSGLTQKWGLGLGTSWCTDVSVHERGFSPRVISAQEGYLRAEYCGPVHNGLLRTDVCWIL